MATNIIPLHDRVVVTRCEQQTTKAGIIIPDTAGEKPVEGVVFAVGPGKIMDNGQLRAMSVKKGQKVLFGKYAGTEVKFDGKDYVVMREDDLMAIIEE